MLRQDFSRGSRLRTGRHDFTILLSSVGVALLTASILVTVACSGSQPPTPDIQTTIHASVRATVTTYRAKATPTPDAQATIDASVRATVISYQVKATPTPNTSGFQSRSLERSAPTPDVAALIAKALELSQATDNTLGQTYTAPSGLWSIRHPDGWESEVMNVAFSDRIVLGGAVESNDGIAFAGVSVETVNDGGLLTLDEVTDGVILANSAILNDFHLLSRYTRAFQSTVAEELLFSHKSPLGPTTSVMIVARSGVHIHTVQVFSLSSSFKDVEEQLRDILHSFRILN